ncbi:Crp/Fnr family transcriptional regulator [Enterococcus dispar]|uniref:Crp/Fnr family transcriptional regulator n=1 Tax=Enterococcus dispar TaxID=44009 RepID=UPI0021D3F386|nr:Crp/Fnr family transcriptional regulator [Enterococcus dispar]MCU7357863.1 Crp/Fnr family transcriptional regulator [Enterococcus dispar]MDT2706125.1 Crp/Fnr family transcriptional regulator [Enterococcus dispar]
MAQNHLCVTLVPLFNHLDEEDQHKINQLVQHHIFQKGEQVITPDGQAQLVIVARGNLKVYQLSAAGREQLLRVIEPGGYEGENLLFGATNHNLFSEALQKTEVCILKQRDFKQLLLDYPELSLKLLEINAEKMTKVEQQSQFLTIEKIEERLSIYLLDLSKVAQCNQVTIPMKMKELAAFLGTTPETLSRKFKLLEKMQLILRTGYHVELLDKAGLEEL